MIFAASVSRTTLTATSSQVSVGETPSALCGGRCWLQGWSMAAPGSMRKTVNSLTGRY